MSTMAEIEKISLPHLTDYTIYAGMFKQVENAPYLRQQLLEGNTAFGYAFLDVSMILSRDHVLAACFRAINDMLNNRLKSRNVHSEIVFSLSPNNNIAESFRRFGISDKTQHVLAIKVCARDDPSAGSVAAHMTENVQGQSIAFSDEEIAKLHDLPRLRKVYKFDVPKDSKGKDVSGSTLVDDAVPSVLGIMALKGS